MGDKLLFNLEAKIQRFKINNFAGEIIKLPWQRFARNFSIQLAKCA